MTKGALTVDVLSLSGINDDEIPISAECSFYVQIIGVTPTSVVFKDGENAVTSTKPHDFYLVDAIYDSVVITLESESQTITISNLLQVEEIKPYTFYTTAT